MKGKSVAFKVAMSGVFIAIATIFGTFSIPIFGTGSLLAFPGSMIGAVLAGILFIKSKKIEAAVVGEIIGTGILGAIVAYPISALILGKDVALFAYIIPFSISCVGGSIIAYIFLKVSIINKFLVNQVS